VVVIRSVPRTPPILDVGEARGAEGAYAFGHPVDLQVAVHEGGAPEGVFVRDGLDSAAVELEPGLDDLEDVVGIVALGEDVVGDCLYGADAYGLDGETGGAQIGPVSRVVVFGARSCVVEFPSEIT
jgi:hypothetical protein